MKLQIDLNSPELLGDIAFKITENILDGCKKEDKKNKKNRDTNKITKNIKDDKNKDKESIEYSLTKSQIRKFYSEFKLIEKKLPANGKIPDELYGQIKLLKAKAIYNKSRKNSALPEPFVEFIEFCVDSIKYEDNGNRQTFLNICKLFEAFVGYSSAYPLGD